MLRTYDRRATPTNKIGQPTKVECELFIRSFGSISEKTMVSLFVLASFCQLKLFVFSCRASARGSSRNRYFLGLNESSQII